MSFQVLSDTDHVARKAHSCIWCGEPIKVGDPYHSQAGKFYGDFQENKYHQECWDVAAEYFITEDEFTPHSFKRGTDNAIK